MPRAPSTRLGALREQKKDFVENLFGMIFGEIEDAPAGFTRMTVETQPDQYPAETAATAAAADGDDGTRGCGRRCCRRSSRGCPCTRSTTATSTAGRPARSTRPWTGGPGVALRGRGRQRFGGYNAKGWVGYGEYRPGLSNFLFAWNKAGENFVKLPKVGGAGMGVVDKPEQGPMFGAEGLCVPMRAENPRLARCKLGPYYARMKGGRGSMLRDGEPGSMVKRMTVYVGNWGAESILRRRHPFSSPKIT
ncbi:hypothetical protein JL720_9908 [Aureococcus anophagefferens]|nr:hypothetical protein JL720_9908 [Aureococcus anophagefferens]